MTSVLENIHAKDWQYIPGVVDGTHEVRKPNGESAASYPCHVLLDDTTSEELQQFAIGLIVSDTNLLAYFWKGEPTEDAPVFPAPRVGDLIQVQPIDSAEPESYSVDRVQRFKLGKYVLALTLLREDVE